MSVLRPTRTGETPAAEERTPRQGIRSPGPAARTAGVLVTLSIAGAIVGAAFGTAPPERFVAEAVVAVQPDPETTDVAGLHAVQWRTAARTALLPIVLQAAARNLGQTPDLTSLQERVSVTGSAGTSLLRIRARDTSTAAAGRLATAVAQETVLFLRRAGRASLQASDRNRSFTFDRGLDGWSGIGSLFAVSPSRVSRDALAQQGGTHALRVVCGRGVGCGAHVRVGRDFLASARYRATIFARAQQLGGPQPRVRLVLGTSARDIAAGESVTLSSTRWQPLSVRWTPSANASSAEIATQTTSEGPTTIFLDTGTVTEDTANVDERVRQAADARSLRQRASRVADGDNYAVLGSASPAGEVEPDTTLWTLGGALLGLLMGGAGLAAAELARRRKHA